MAADYELSATELEDLRRLFEWGMNALSAEKLPVPSACPDSETMISYVSNAASDDVRRELNAHIAFCDDCWDDYVALVGVETIAASVRKGSLGGLPVAIGDLGDHWVRLVSRARDFTIDIAQKYGPGTLIGAVKVHSAVPVIARGELESERSQILEIMIEDEVYGIEVRLHKDQLTFDVAGYKLSGKGCLTIAVQNDTGERLAEVQADRWGNAQMALPRQQYQDGEILLVVGKGSLIHEVVMLRVPIS